MTTQNSFQKTPSLPDTPPLSEAEATERAAFFAALQEKPPDIVIAGGGILGAGIFREATLAGLRVVLLDAMDFGWGASSCSSKMIHGGLRYLQTGRFDITYHAVRERKKLIDELPALITPQDFAIPAYSRWRKFIFWLGLSIYDFFSRRTKHKKLSNADLRTILPSIREDRLIGGYAYTDALTDDSRLVLRTLHDATAAGGLALNYARVLSSKKTQDGACQIEVEDTRTQERYSLRAPVLVNATGFNADALRTQRGKKPMMRPLRGSHLIFSKERIPLKEIIVFDHPADGRSVYLVPWQGCVYLGTTEADDEGRADQLPALSPHEQRYLLDAANYILPHAKLQASDILSVWAGLRPIVSAGKKNTYKEPRDIQIEYEDGLLTIAGGKLTTFRSDAIRALRCLAPLFPRLGEAKAHPFLSPTAPHNSEEPASDAPTLHRQHSAYGVKYPLFSGYQEADETPLHPAGYLPAHLRFALRHEWVCHLDDLLIRRTRLGLLLPEGGKALFPLLEALCLEAGWSKERFEGELTRYQALFDAFYRPHDDL